MDSRYILFYIGHVAQWTRACGYEPQGRGFESLLAQIWTFLILKNRKSFLTPYRSWTYLKKIMSQLPNPLGQRCFKNFVWSFNNNFSSLTHSVFTFFHNVKNEVLNQKWRASLYPVRDGSDRWQPFPYGLY